MLLKMRGSMHGVGKGSRLLFTVASGEQPAVVIGVNHGDTENTYTLPPAGT